MRKATILRFIQFILLLVASSAFSFEGEKLSINSGWQFLRLEPAAQDKSFNAPKFDDSDWQTVSLPHTAHIEPLLVNDQWQGICWYRKVLEVPVAMSGKRFYIEFEGAMNYSETWLNGTLIKKRHGGYLPNVIDVTDHLNVGEPNLLAVRLDNTDNPVTGPQPLKKLDFCMYGGLYRNAWLIVKNPIHLSHPILADKVAGGGLFITTLKASKEESIVNLKAHVINEGDDSKSIKVVHSVYFNRQLIKKQEAQPESVGGGEGIEFEEQISLIDAKLWSPAEPNLYQIKTQVFAGDQMVDEQTNQIGIREFVFRDNDLYLNGVKTFLRGINRHQGYPYIGYALSDNAQYRDARKIKDAGFEYIRLAHYPHSTAFMKACDELGLVVLNPILGWQFQADTDEFREYCYRSARDLIRRDRNHPCVLAWEVSLNETWMPIPFTEELHRITHAEYPGKNVYSCGWMPKVYDIYLQARQHRMMHKGWHAPPKPYIVSEYGDWEYYSRNPILNTQKLSAENRDIASSRQLRSFGEARLLQQAKNLQEAHNDNLNTPAVADGYWLMFDYNRGNHDDIEASGISDICRLPKFSYLFYQSQRAPSDKAIVNIASYWTPKSPLDLKVYSNCETVELYLNDRLVAKQTPDSDPNTGNLAHPPFTFDLKAFEPGRLKAVGRINGKTVAEHTVTTPQEATGLKLRLDESEVPAKAGVNDVLFLYLSAVDENGTLAPDFSGTIELSLPEGVELINVGPLTAEAGIATALIRFGEAGGDFYFKANAEGLEVEELIVSVK